MNKSNVFGGAERGGTYIYSPHLNKEVRYTRGAIIASLGATEHINFINDIYKLTDITVNKDTMDKVITSLGLHDNVTTREFLSEVGAVALAKYEERIKYVDIAHKYAELDSLMEELDVYLFGDDNVEYLKSVKSNYLTMFLLTNTIPTINKLYNNF